MDRGAARFALMACRLRRVAPRRAEVILPNMILLFVRQVMLWYGSVGLVVIVGGSSSSLKMPIVVIFDGPPQRSTLVHSVGYVSSLADT